MKHFILFFSRPFSSAVIRFSLLYRYFVMLHPDKFILRPFYEKKDSAGKGNRYVQQNENIDKSDKKLQLAGYDLDAYLSKF